MTRLMARLMTSYLSYLDVLGDVAHQRLDHVEALAGKQRDVTGERQSGGYASSLGRGCDMSRNWSTATVKALASEYVWSMWGAVSTHTVSRNW